MNPLRSLVRRDLGWMIVVISVGLMIRSADASDDRLIEVIGNIEANEELYRELDVRIRTHYDIGDRAPVQLNGGEEIVRKDFDTHFVSQDGKFRLESKGGEFDAKQAESSRDKVRLFGGERTKLLVANSTGNVIVGRSEDDEFIRPHTFLARYSSIPVPLSTYFRGHKAIAAAMGNNNWLQNLELVVTGGGDGEFEGMKCQKVIVTTILPGGDAPELTKAEFWLAEERNYIPVRMILWDLKRSAEIPRIDGFVGQLQEVKDGIWFPVDAQISAYEQMALQSQGKQQLAWREEYFVDSVSLEPKYDQAYFDDLEFPTGTAVYEVERGEIKKSYRVGAPDAREPQRAAGSSYLWLLYGNVAIAGLVVAVLVLRRRKSVKSVTEAPPGTVA